MAATVSAWGKPGAWALDSEENEVDLLQQHKDEFVNGNHHINGGDAAALSDFPSLSIAASTKTKKKKGQTLSLQEFNTYGTAKPAQARGLTHEEIMMLPSGPRERTAEELDRSRLGGGFRSYGSRGDESSNSRWGSSRVSSDEPRRQGESNRDVAPSRADEIDDWGAAKKSVVGNGFERKERGGFFSDSQSRADESDSWVSSKNFVPSEGRKSERRVGFESSGGADSENWVRRKEEEGRRFGGTGGAFDSLRERRSGSELPDSDNWGKKREEESGNGRRKLNLKPRTLPVADGLQNGSAAVVKLPVADGLQNRSASVVKLPVAGELQNGSTAAAVVKPKSSNPFGEARPREDVLKEKGKDWKEIDEKLESMKIKDVAGLTEGTSFGKRSFGNGNGRVSFAEEGTERSWRKTDTVDVRPQSAEKIDNGHPEEANDTDPHM